MEEHSKHEEKSITIYVNGRAKALPKNDEVSFEEIIRLAFENPPSGDGVQFTVQYSRGSSSKPTGTLVEGQKVKIKEGMEFDVTPTNRS
jgi:hypothetical protein